jgi:hypothetical protein
MLYYSDEARKSAISSIKECILKIGTIPGQHLSYSDARKTTTFLNMLIDEIEKESKCEHKKERE